MKNLLTRHRYSLSLVLSFIFIQSFFVEFNNPYKNPIAGDAQGYYAYLPAIFIYGDLQFEFVKPLQEKYYAPSLQKSFLNQVDGQHVNKTFPGVTILYLPGFVLAHSLAIMGVAEADGYSWIYQFCFLLNFWFFVFLGFNYCVKVLLQNNIDFKTATLSTFTIFITTNLFFYTVFDQSVTHVYTFFLVAFTTHQLLKNRFIFNLKSTLLFFSFFALILIVRPTNILVILVYLFFIPERSFYKNYFGHLFKLKNFLLITLISFMIIGIAPLLWKLQTGHWIVYSYGEEGFNFAQPELFNFLFSYTKGWFVYTPITLLLLFVSIAIFYKNQRSQLVIFIIGILIIIYVYSSWWCWYYGAGMSQRVMIDFYILFVFVLAKLHQKLSTAKPWYKFVIALLISIITCVNVVQAFQIAKGILPFGSPTKEQYWDNFLSLQKRAIFYAPEHWQLINSGHVNLQNNQGQIVKGNSVDYENTPCLSVNNKTEYSATASLPQLTLKPGDKVVFSFEAKSKTAVKESRVVFSIDSTLQHVFYLEPYCTSNWGKMEYLIEIENKCIYSPTIFIWNAGSGEEVWIRNISWRIYFSDEYF